MQRKVESDFPYFSHVCLLTSHQSTHTPPHSSHAINLPFFLSAQPSFSRTFFKLGEITNYSHCRLSFRVRILKLIDLLSSAALAFAIVHKFIVIFFQFLLTSLLHCNIFKFRSTKLRKSSQRWLTRWRAFKCAEKVNMKGRENGKREKVCRIVEVKFERRRTRSEKNKLYGKLFIFIYRLSVELEGSDSQLWLHEQGKKSRRKTNFRHTHTPIEVEKLTLWL